MKNDYPILQTCPLFQNMEPAGLTDMLSCLHAKTVVVIKNQTILREGDPAGNIGIVLSGTVQVIREDYDGNRNIVSIIEAGQMFAEVFACAGLETMPVSVTAVSDSEILFVDCRRILTGCPNACEFHGRLIGNLLKIVATKSLMLNQKIEIISKRTTREKLLTYLRMQAKQCGSREFTIPYDRQALADYLGAERSAMSAEIGKLCKEGVIESRKSWFKLLE